MSAINNQIFQVTEIKDPKLREIGDSIVDLMKLSITKAIANQVDPRTALVSKHGYMLLGLIVLHELSQVQKP